MQDGFVKARLLLRGRYTALSLRFHTCLCKRFWAPERRRQLKAALDPNAFLGVRSREHSLCIHVQH